jgi:hypothetical protein
MTHFEKTYLDTVPVYAFLLFLLGGTAVFMLRPPIVVITDDVFSAIYGARREHIKRIEMSARLFRRVKLTRISEGVEVDAVVLAAQDAGRGARAVLFPYRYYDAAIRYAAQNLKAAVVVLSGINKAKDGSVLPGSAAILYAGQDETADFYRAGLCAALISSREVHPVLFPKIQDNDKTVLLIANERNSPESAGFFEQGLRKEGSDAYCAIKSMNDSYPLSDISCVTLMGQANNFLYNSMENTIPLIVYSWIDSDFSSPNVKVIIDDSPLQLLPEIVKLLGRRDIKARLRAGESTEALIPSTFKVISLRIGSLPMLLRLNIAVNLPAVNLQNGDRLTSAE